jgi:hypothetical protein
MSQKYLSVEDVASICHEANRALCDAAGDHTQMTWVGATDSQRRSAVEGVKFHLLNPDATPRQSHKEWMRHKLAEGWRYGAVKDEGARTHPCLVEYDELPAHDRAKDYLFRAIVHSLQDFTTAPEGTL